MGKHRISHKLGLLLAALVCLSTTALAGKDYIAANKLLKRGDAKGLAAMEKVCKKEPFASNAFLDLARGYLRIKGDAAMAMDAAVRGLEGYSEKWQWKVPKKNLYDVFGQAAAKAKPEDLRKYLPRIEKLAKRDGALTKPLLERYAQHLPGNALKGIFARAKATEAARNLGGALKLYEEAAKLTKEAGLEARFATEFKHAEEVISMAGKERDAALALAKPGTYDQCFKALEALSRKYQRHSISTQAAQKLTELKGSDEVKAARIAEAAKAKEAEGDKLLAEARALLAKGEYVKAAAALKRIAAAYDGTPSAKAASVELEKLAKNPKASAAIQAAQAEKECRGLLGTARSFIMNNMKDKARAKLDLVISKYPGTKWAKQAEEMKKGL